MKIFDANISHQVSKFLNNELKRITLYEKANHKLLDIFGVNSFFENQEDLVALKEIIGETESMVEEPSRGEYGDFQTNHRLANYVTEFLKEKLAMPDIIVEPTCGKGSFIIAALKTFPDVEKIIGVEIFKPYVWETKFNIIQYYLDNPREKKPVIEIYHFNVFNFDFKQIANNNINKEILLIGNPPWVTNSKLSSLKSNNLPEKSNFKKHNGFDAITGKGNFDIGEYIILMMFDAFHNLKGNFAFLVKNSVVKNVVFDQKQKSYNISDIQKQTIDSKKEFNVSVEASLLYCKLNKSPDFTCKEFNFYSRARIMSQFGWIQDNYVSNIEYYKHSGDIEGACPFEWRQGVKHDLSSIMEIERVNDHFINRLDEEILLEDDLVYGFLKSSDLKEPIIDKTRKFTIITQKKVGQDTSFIKKEYPKTYKYLQRHKDQFISRKSSIYNGKPQFSIFGIGDYSFKPYKVAISGLYKTYTFSLVLPQYNKPIMLDDTCYLLGFDHIEYAVYTLILLNSNKAREFLLSITFPDAKRIFTKDILMRIDLYKLAMQFSGILLEQELESLNEKYTLNLNLNKWNNFIDAMKPAKVKQMSMFV